MKPGARWAVVAAIILFLAWVVYDTMSGTSVTCEVCLVFNDGEVCRRGAGETTEQALSAAQESACGGNTGGMADMIACRSRPPSRSTCSP